MPTTCPPPPVTSKNRTYVRNVHAPHAARRFVHAQLEAWGLGHLVDTAQLVVSELVTNAVKAAKGDTVEVRLQRSGGAVCIKVWDDNPEPPVTQTPGTLDEHGRGLMITTALSEHWGCYRVSGVGKVVYAMITKGMS